MESLVEGFPKHIFFSTAPFHGARGKAMYQSTENFEVGFDFGVAQMHGPGFIDAFHYFKHALPRTPIKILNDPAQASIACSLGQYLQPEPRVFGTQELDGYLYHVKKQPFKDIGTIEDGRMHIKDFL